MMNTSDNNEWQNELREQALARPHTNECDLQAMSEADKATMIHELQTYQIELEIQNEELRRTQHELHESHDRVRYLYDHAPVGYLTLNTKGVIEEANLSAAQMLDCAPGILVGKPFSAYIDPNSQDAYYFALQEIKQSQGKKACDLELTVMQSGNGSRWVHMDAVFEEAEGEFTSRILCTLADITESRRTDEELQKVQRLESLGILAGGIAHDFNNLLGGIFGHIDLALLYADENGPVAKHLNESGHALERAKDLTQQLLTFSKGGSPAKRVLSITDALENSARLSLGGSNVHCEFDFGPGLSQVEGDAGQLSQAFGNLFLNARQAMPEGGVITVRATECSPGGCPDLMEQRYIKIAIEDQGVGIPSNLHHKIFDPFFSTKEEGSGLGLATAFSIISRHGGRIRVSSKEGHGTTMTVLLPASERTEDSEPPVYAEPKHGTGRILVMDDEDLIRQVVSGLLTEIGYDVEVCEDGCTALQAYEGAFKTDAAFDVVILDLTIPGGMGGVETVAKLHELDPEACVVVSSGYSDSPVFADPQAYGFAAAIMKPYRLQGLATLLEGLLKVKTHA